MRDSLKNYPKKLDVLIKLTAVNVIQGKNLTQQVDILSGLNIDNKHIAMICNSKPDTVSHLKSRLKKRDENEVAKEKPKQSTEGKLDRSAKSKGVESS